MVWYICVLNLDDKWCDVFINYFNLLTKIIVCISSTECKHSSVYFANILMLMDRSTKDLYYILKCSINSNMICFNYLSRRNSLYNEFSCNKRENNMLKTQAIYTLLKSLPRSNQLFKIICLKLSWTLCLASNDV